MPTSEPNVPGARGRKPTPPLVASTMPKKSRTDWAQLRTNGSRESWRTAPTRRSGVSSIDRPRVGAWDEEDDEDDEDDEDEDGDGDGDGDEDEDGNGGFPEGLLTGITNNETVEPLGIGSKTESTKRGGFTSFEFAVSRPWHKSTLKCRRESGGNLEANN
ncbi:MAG: hypothetical protein ACI8W3_000822 [Myxococcota bacterium]|jgi:hypothetical protein